MSKYIIEFKQTKASAVLEYNENGWLVKYELDPGAFEEAQHKAFSSHFPSSLFILEKWNENKNVKIKHVPIDVSFDAFWTAYDYKVGKKPRCIRLWDALSENERVKAIKHIEVYNSWLAPRSIDKQYPETYLHNQIWNN